MRTLAFDLGTKTGWGITDSGKLVASGMLHLGPDDQYKYVNFLKLFRGLVKKFSPEMTAYEMVHHNTGFGAHVIQGCRGIVEAISAELGLLCVPVNVMTAKKIITGTGAATKEEMTEIVLTIYGPFEHALNENEADAIGVAHAAESMVLVGEAVEEKPKAKRKRAAR